ncbi:hypothetical protein OG462_43955 [Streptomyces sp. NBC_01077]|uniref:hypothetical protein n=1 Tax=Streptomyces sp. NBC_01077 TaxID=2903746 RepID=UPI00386DFD9B|nr:hypothetical protein OG462_01050 [Streptomyces sp. NBC_01077]WSV43689.1 hypothetical protein OG462_43955 [Streptomyces sp. NBC_01077]
MRIGRPTAALSVLLATACGAAETGDSPPPIGEVKKVMSANDISLPLDAYDLTSEERSALQQVYDLMGTACMKEKGFKVTMPERRPEDAESIYGRRYFIINMAEAERYGYRPSRMMEKKEKQSPSGLESKAALTAWLGHDPDDESQDPNSGKGCGAAAHSILEEGVGQDSDVVIHELSAESWHRSEEDSRMQKVFKAWSSCMAKYGFEYTTPIQSNNDKRWQQKVVSDLEIATAKADISCKQKTNLPGMWLALESAYQKRAIETHSEALRIRREAWDKRMRNAHKALGG